MGKSVTLVDGDGVGDTISDVEDHTGGTTGGVQGEDGLDAHVSVGKKELGVIKKFNFEKRFLKVTKHINKKHIDLG